MGIGFVIMPFGNGFDEIYKEIYAPAIASAGLTPLRADEIYDNQAIAQDIYHSIHNAEVILADVTGKNPNVNYELGAAHALGKEVIITTASGSDVPSDYRHLRYIEYRRGDLDWNRKLLDSLTKTLQTVLHRLHNAETDGVCLDSGLDFHAVSRDEAFVDDCMLLEQAKACGFERCFYDSANSILSYEDCYVQIDVREGGDGAEWAPIAYLLNEDVRRLAAKLPTGHFLKMRWLFIDKYACHGFGIDYIYNTGSLPIFTKTELYHALKRDFMGDLFEPQFRYLEEGSSGNPSDSQVLGNDFFRTIPSTEDPISWRNGAYVAEIDRVYQNSKAGHFFYCLKARLPLSTIGATSYAPKESHWLADWSQTEPRCAEGDIVSFKLQKIYALASWNHTANARNVNFSDLKILKHK